MKKIFLFSTIITLAACSNQNDVAIQQAYAASRAQECAAVASIASSGAASEAAVLMAARGCGGGAAPQTSADRAIQLAGALAPVAGALINGAVAIKQGEQNADIQKENIAAGTARAGIDASVLTTLGKDQVIEVRPEVVQAPAPVIVEQPAPTVIETPAPTVIETPAPVIIEQPAPQVCSTNQNGVLVCK